MRALKWAKKECKIPAANKEMMETFSPQEKALYMQASLHIAEPSMGPSWEEMEGTAKRIDAGGERMSDVQAVWNHCAGARNADEQEKARSVGKFGIQPWWRTMCLPHTSARLS